MTGWGVGELCNRTTNINLLTSFINVSEVCTCNVLL